MHLMYGTLGIQLIIELQEKRSHMTIDQGQTMANKQSISRDQQVKRKRSEI